MKPSSKRKTFLDSTKAHVESKNKVLGAAAGILEKAGLELSKNRAKAVSYWLIMNKISKDRLSYKGYADDEPIMSNEIADGRSKNRRTEFKIIGK